VDVTVDEDAAAELRVLYEETGGVVFVASLRTKDRGAAYGAGEGGGVGGEVGGIEAAGETAHYFLGGVGAGGLEDFLALFILC
jgi:hypothetical protein